MLAFYCESLPGNACVCPVRLDASEQRQQEGAALIERHLQRESKRERVAERTGGCL